MKILSKRRVNSILTMVSALQVMANRWDHEDPEFLEKATEALAEIAYDVAGVGGMNRVKKAVWKWEKER